MTGPKRIVFTVDGEPRAWARARRDGGRMFTDSRTAAYKRSVGFAAKAAGVRPLPGPVFLLVSVFLKRPKRLTRRRIDAMNAGRDRPTKKPDADNFLKLVADALNGIAYADDAQIVETTVMKSWADEERDGWLRVTVEDLS